MAFEPRFGVTLGVAVLTETVLTYLLNLVIIYSMRTFPVVAIMLLLETAKLPVALQ